MAGGYQRPGSPAPVSGPGRLSKRTDSKQPVREMPNAAYGEAAEYRSLQQQAPLPATPSVPSGGAAPRGGGAMTGGAGGVVGLDAPSQMPGMPVTAGASMGAGPGMEALGLPDPNEDLRARLWAAYQQFPSEDLREILEAMDEG